MPDTYKTGHTIFVWIYASLDYIIQNNFFSFLYKTVKVNVPFEYQTYSDVYCMKHTWLVLPFYFRFGFLFLEKNCDRKMTMFFIVAQ
jgi:hypothetical protein